MLEANLFLYVVCKVQVHLKTMNHDCFQWLTSNREDVVVAERREKIAVFLALCVRMRCGEACVSGVAINTLESRRMRAGEALRLAGCDTCSVAPLEQQTHTHVLRDASHLDGARKQLARQLKL